jgi:formylglycine-generating enzyme required for sulfatase activity/DUF1680 family protein
MKPRLLTRTRLIVAAIALATTGWAADKPDAKKPAPPHGPAPTQATSAVESIPFNSQPMVDGWKRIPDLLHYPERGVALNPGPLAESMERNRRYIIETCTVDAALHYFHLRAGLKPQRTPRPFWESDLESSSAGRLLGAAGNYLRWHEDAELRQRLNAVVAGIAAVRRADGWCLPYDADRMLVHEHPNYDRVMLTHGLIAAGMAGNAQALDLARGLYDCIEAGPWLAKMASGQLCYQGMVGFTRMYFTPVGKPGDIATILGAYHYPQWLAAMARGEESAVWRHWYSHSYILTAAEAWLDVYRATGSALHGDAARACWRMFRERWMLPGGLCAICENNIYPPGSLRIAKSEHTGETCGSVFWIQLNQRLRCLEPDDTRYADEIEATLWNAILGAQEVDGKIRYHQRLMAPRERERGTGHNSCCEIQASRIIASIPELLYALGDGFIAVDQYAPSTIRWRQNGADLSLTCRTTYPANGAVALEWTGAEATYALRLRMPGWLATKVPISVDGAVVAEGRPGSYCDLRRDWKPGMKVTFDLPMPIRAQRYRGLDRGSSPDRYVLFRGPDLLVCVDATEKSDSKNDPNLINPDAGAVLFLSAEKSDSKGDPDLILPVDASQPEATLRADGEGWTVPGQAKLRLQPYRNTHHQRFAGIVGLNTPVVTIDPQQAGPWIPPETHHRLRIILNSGSMEFVPVEPTTFEMGQDGHQQDRYPAHRVSITKRFWLATTEVTQNQWQAFSSDNPSENRDPACPVERVAWNEATAWCERLAQALAPRGLTARLPTEAEWELGCRGNLTGTSYQMGNDIEKHLKPYAWYMDTWAKRTTKPVGSKLPNVDGFFDMLGNVSEWCADWYDPMYYAGSPATDPAGPANGVLRVARGGSIDHYHPDVQCTSRGAWPPDTRSSIIGFRVLIERLMPARMNQIKP